MKKFFLFIMLLCLSAPIMVAQTGGDDPIGILIGEGGVGVGGPSHHAPALIPISAAYYASLSTIVVNFQFNMGSVSVEIENETTGEYTQTTVNALAGPMPFLISGTAGHWIITCTLSNGVQYYGEFEV